MPEPGDAVASRPGGWLPDADAIAAMMPPVMGEAGVIDDLLPGGIDGLRSRPRSDRADNGIESAPHDACDLRVLVANGTNVDEAAERRVIARHATGELEKDRLASFIVSVAPGGMFLAEPAARPDEGAEARRMA